MVLSDSRWPFSVQKRINFLIISVPENKMRTKLESAEGLGQRLSNVSLLVSTFSLRAADLGLMKKNISGKLIDFIQISLFTVCCLLFV